VQGWNSSPASKQRRSLLPSFMCSLAAQNRYCTVSANDYYLLGRLALRHYNRFATLCSAVPEKVAFRQTLSIARVITDHGDDMGLEKTRGLHHGIDVSTATRGNHEDDKYDGTRNRGR
jgi:hypothetical protein